jgi:CRP-like cAMP-binding protein
LHAGQIFGEQALTTDKPRGGTIISKTDLKVVSLNKQNFKVYKY